MKQKTWKRILYGSLLVSAILLLFIVRPAFHIARSAWNDSSELPKPPPGTADDASRLNQTRVLETWPVPPDTAAAEQQLVALLQRAHSNHLHVSIAGARHTMGGHTLYPGGIVIDMLPFNHMELDVSNSVLHVQAGARWNQIIPFLNARGFSIEVMQSNDDFSVGGSISANCHGWQINRAPIISTVQSFRLMLCDGRIVRCSRTENEELFSLAPGGYGLFGIILDADLHIVPNESYELERVVVRTADFAKVLASKTGAESDVAMAYGRLSVTREDFLNEAVLNFFHRVPGTAGKISPLTGEANGGLKRSVFRGSAGDDYGKELRWTAERWLDPYLSGTRFDRNQLLYDPVALFQDRSRRTTDILMECFVPAENMESLVADLCGVLATNDVDLLNVTVRHVLTDRDSFLRYARTNMLSLVMLFSQSRDAAGEEKMARAARGIIEATLLREGTYYLPYRLHATPEQFDRAYPNARRFFELKRKHDAAELFQNLFYQQYGNPVSAIHEN